MPPPDTTTATKAESRPRKSKSGKLGKSSKHRKVEIFLSPEEWGSVELKYFGFLNRAHPLKFLPNEPFPISSKLVAFISGTSFATSLLGEAKIHSDFFQRMNGIHDNEQWAHVQRSIDLIDTLLARLCPNLRLRQAPLQKLEYKGQSGRWLPIHLHSIAPFAIIHNFKTPRDDFACEIGCCFSLLQRYPKKRAMVVSVLGRKIVFVCMEPNLECPDIGYKVWNIAVPEQRVAFAEAMNGILKAYKGVWAAVNRPV